MRPEEGKAGEGQGSQAPRSRDSEGEDLLLPEPAPGPCKPLWFSGLLVPLGVSTLLPALSCLPPGPDTGCWAHSLPPSPEPAPADRPRFAVWLSLQVGNPAADEEGHSFPAPPTQQLRPHLQVLAILPESAPFLCLFTPRRGALAPGPMKATLFWASLGPGSVLSAFLGNVTGPPPPCPERPIWVGGVKERAVGRKGVEGRAKPSFCFLGGARALSLPT